MAALDRPDRELFRLFESNSLKAPLWLIKVVNDQLRKDAVGKEARYGVYRVVWSRLKTKGTITGGTAVYPEAFVACMNSIFPDQGEHKNYGKPTVSLEDIAKA